MNSQALIDRKFLQGLKFLLEQPRTKIDAKYTLIYGVARALEAPAPVPDAGEGVEVVCWRTNRDQDPTFPRLHKTEDEAQGWVDCCNNGPRITKESLMTVAQHNRIVSALSAKLESAINGWMATAEVGVSLSALQASAMVVPDGWKLVPVEPTEDMQAAGQASGKNCSFSYAACYRAMLAASSAPGGDV